ncbi:MAG: tRNA (adenosine(37)-N6)-threonylcarbamoyltransferase complex transferase subunit TsaD, partial [Acidobacteriota bacterium]
GDKRAIIFPLAQINDEAHRLDFSFSGLKTSVLRYVKDFAVPKVVDADNPSQQILDLCASFQNAVVRALVRGVRRAAEIYQPQTILLAGGVACNTELRAAITSLAEELRVPTAIPSPVFTTDNAAMIAAAGYPRLRRGDSDGLGFNADVSLRLQNIDLENAVSKKKVRYRI